MNLAMNDASTLNFVVSQMSHIEMGVYAKKYPDIQYPDLIPVDTSANAWAKTVTFFSGDTFGAADFINGNGANIPMAGITRDIHEEKIQTAAIGYGWGIEEVNQASMMGTNLPSENAFSARRAYEQLVDAVALRGQKADGAAVPGMSGLINNAAITAVIAPTGASGGTEITTKTALEALADVNNLLAGVYIDTNTVEISDTILMSEQVYQAMANKVMPDGMTTLMGFIRQNSILMQRFGRDLTIRAVRGLNTAGAGGTSRMVAYRRDPEVLKLHLPMPLRFLPIQTKGLRFEVPGLFRLGGLEIRLPGAVRYLDGV